MRLISVQGIGQELQGRIYIRVGFEELVGCVPFLQVEVRVYKREETGQVRAQRRDTCWKHQILWYGGV